MNRERRPTIVVVDDVPENVRLLEAVLTPRGYNVVSATNGEDALQLVAAVAPDLVLLDVVMPGMDGYTVCTKLREQEEIDSIRPDLDGTQIMEILGISPGREVGAAYKHLLELRMEHGPLGAERAEAELRAWWASRRLNSRMASTASVTSKPWSARWAPGRRSAMPGRLPPRCSGPA